MRPRDAKVLHVVLASTIAVAGAAMAQPQGPRDVIVGARKAREQQEMKSAIGAVDSATTTSSPLPITSDASAAPASPHSPHAAGVNPHAGLSATRKPMDEGWEDKSLPPGTLHVRVVDAQEQPLVGVDVRVGILKADGGRESLSQKTDAAGIAVLSSLLVGDRQAYRAELTADGARFSSTPFRMPHAHGYHVVLRRLPTTHDDTNVVLYVGAVSVELKDDRLKIAQQLRLVNIGSKVYVFPAGGKKIPLPKGFTAFQSQENMSDQRVSSTETELKIEGSIPPGQTNLLWGFDLPIEGSEMTVDLVNPWTTFAYRVLADAAPGLTLSVDDMPAAQQQEAQEGSYWVVESMRQPDQQPLRHVRIHLAGIPGPGPYRFIAAGLALLALGLGFALSRRSIDADSTLRSLAARKQALTERLSSLTREHQAGEIGPETFALEKGRLTDALALLLWQESQQQKDAKSKRGPSTASA